MMDGLYDCWPLSTLDTYFSTRMAVPCYLSIYVTADSGSTQTSGTLNIQLHTDIGFDTDATIHAIINESGIPGTGTYQPSGTPFNYALRENLFGANGTTVSFGPTPETIDLSVPYTIPSSWDWDQLYLTTFVQGITTDEIMNSDMLELSDIVGTGIEEPEGMDALILSIDPNPSTGTIHYSTAGIDSPVMVSVFSIDGRLIGSSTLAEGMFVIQTAGVYTIRVETSLGRSVSRQAVVIR